MRLLLILALLLESSRAWAQAQPADRAVELGRAALEAYFDGDWDAAYERFEQADQLRHSPVFVLYMARCKRNSGELLVARDHFRLLAREPLPPSAPAPWQQAVTAAHSELGSLQQSIPSVWISPVASGHTVFIDGRQIAPSQGPLEIELDPGEHDLELVDARGGRTRQTILLSEGRRRVPVHFRGRAHRELSARPRAAAEAAPYRQGPPELQPWRTTAGWAALGIGAAGVGLGIFSGVRAKILGDRLTCNRANVCDRRDLPEFETASDWAAVATVSLIFSSASLASGAALLMLPTPSSPGSPRAGLAIQGAF